jgi:hypothetical protein
VIDDQHNGDSAAPIPNRKAKAGRKATDKGPQKLAAANAEVDIGADVGASGDANLRVKQKHRALDLAATKIAQQLVVAQSLSDNQNARPIGTHNTHIGEVTSAPVNAPTVYVTLTDLRRSFVEVQRVLWAGAQVIVLKRGVPVATLSRPNDLLLQAFQTAKS